MTKRMERPSRRDFLAGMVAGGAALTLGRSARGAARSTPPHYVVHIVLMGGFDAILSVDPRDPSTISAGGIETGYRNSDLVKGKRRLYGPYFAPLMRHEADLCFVHGVRAETVNHPDGLAALLRGRSTYSASTPFLGDVLGEVLPGDAPLPYLECGPVPTIHARQGLSSIARVSPDMLNALHSTDGPSPADFAARPWAAVVAEAHARDAKRILAATPEQAAAQIKDARSATALRQLLATMPKHSKFKPDSTEFTEGPMFDMALHAIETNAAKCIQIVCRNFDTHTDNMNGQAKRQLPVFEAIATFLDSLRDTRNEFGSLFEQTTVVVCSEFGRFPRFNSRAGKDHWPENTWILAGKGVRRDADGLTVGATDELYKGKMVDHQTGATTGGDPRPIYTETMGATLVKLAGGDPTKFDYATDRVLSCILA